jgi:hypothetical protein
MSRTHRIEMIFYTHPWTIHLLAQEQVIDKHADSVLIEVSDSPNLLVLCPDSTARSQGTLGLLRRPSRIALRSLAQSYKLIPAPVVLAPNPPAPTQLVIDSLLVLDNKIDHCDVVYLLCHIANARRFSAVFGICDRFKLVWDAADYPSETLVDCMAALDASGCLTGGRWGGITVCNHWMRQSADIEYNRRVVQDVALAAGL